MVPTGGRANGRTKRPVELLQLRKVKRGEDYPLGPEFQSARCRECYEEGTRDPASPSGRHLEKVEAVERLSIEHDRASLRAGPDSDWLPLLTEDDEAVPCLIRDLSPEPSRLNVTGGTLRRP